MVPSGELEELVAALTEGGQRIAVLALHPPLGTYRLRTWINGGRGRRTMRTTCTRTCARSTRRGCARILVQEVPADERWDAARDRLQRAAAASAGEHAQRRRSGVPVGEAP